MKFHKVDDDSNVWKCSNCKELWQLLEGTAEENNYNFCPGCGAEAQEKDDESD